MTDPSTPVITRIRPLRPRGLKVELHLDEGEPFEVMLEALERHGLGIGDSLTPGQRHDLLEEDAGIRVRDAALNLLSYRARTRSELKRRLRQKGFAPDRIDPCLDRLQEKGFIDDASVAAAFIRDRLRHRPRGRVALSAELRAKGVSRETVDQAIEDVFDENDTDDPGLARTVAEGWVARQSRETLDALASREHHPERTKVKRRLVAHLGRRGFRGQALTAGIDRAFELAGR